MNCTMTLSGKPPMRWRFDKKCGIDYPLPDGNATECNPDGWYPCCSSSKGECGNTADHCTCVGCTDYRDVKKWRDEGYYVFRIT